MATVQPAKRPSAAVRKPLEVRLPLKGVTYTAKAFWDLCRLNPDLPFERNSDGSVGIMTPVGGEGSRQSSETFGQLFIWTRANGEGIAFDSSIGFTFPNGAVRSPDASWIQSKRWFEISTEQQVKFPPIVPDFVAEVRSDSDRLPALQKKMREYMEQGVRLGWLIDPQSKSVEIYRPKQATKRIENAKTLRGDPELPGFVLDLKLVWAAKKSN